MNRISGTFFLITALISAGALADTLELTDVDIGGELQPLVSGDFRLVGERGGWRINWFPLAAPLRPGGDSYGNASISPTVNPMALLGMNQPGGEPYYPREEWSRSEKRYRNSLVATVTVKNREDNARDD